MFVSISGPAHITKRRVELMSHGLNVRFEAHNGRKSDMARRPKCADFVL
jgi:hypothetical protein